MSISESSCTAGGKRLSMTPGLTQSEDGVIALEEMTDLIRDTGRPHKGTSEQKRLRLCAVHCTVGPCSAPQPKSAKRRTVRAHCAPEPVHRIRPPVPPVRPVHISTRVMSVKATLQSVVPD